MKMNKKMTVPKFTPSESRLSPNSRGVRQQMNDLLCPIFIRHFTPYFNIIKGGKFYALWQDVEQELYCIEDMLRSGQIDEYTQLINSEAIKVRLRCIQNFENEQKHKISKKVFTFKFDENELIKCYKCKKLSSTTFFIDVRGFRLTQGCFKCRGQAKTSLYKKRCSRCV